MENTTVSGRVDKDVLKKLELLAKATSRFKFIFAGRGELEMGKADIVIDRMRQELNQHLSMAYEKVAKELIWNHLDQFFPFTNVGKW